MTASGSDEAAIDLQTPPESENVAPGAGRAVLAALAAIPGDVALGAYWLVVAVRGLRHTH